MAQVAASCYGKDNIRVFKVDRDEQTGQHTATEMTVCVLLQGDIESSYTRADNSVVVPTDTMKQTTYILAKQHPVNPPELFASVLASHFVDTYKHIHTATVTVKQHRWTRMTVDGKAHPHSFLRDGTETRNVEVAVKEGAGVAIRSAIAGLMVLKTTGSAFHGFIKDDYTMLKDTHDRILSTEVDCAWNWKSFASLLEVEDASSTFDSTWRAAREITLDLFAKDESASVQNTVYKMCQEILVVEKTVESVEYSLPNKHYFEIDLSWHNGLQNTGKDAQVYAPQSDPNGLIKCTVKRS